METIKLDYEGPALDQLAVLLADHGFWPDKTCPPVFNEHVDDAVRDFQATALGPDKKPLRINGIVDADTWWALQHYNGDDQRLNLEDDRIPVGLSARRVAVINEYLKLVDAKVHEEPLGSNRGPEIDALFPQWLQDKLRGTKEKGPAWCCFCYTACYHRGTGEHLLGRIQGSCSRAVKLAKQQGIYVPNTAPPVPGDAGVILHGNGTGHIGVVYRVNGDGTAVNMIEGNVSNRVGIRERECAALAGFIRADSDMCLGFERGLVKAKKGAGDSTR